MDRTPGVRQKAVCTFVGNTEYEYNQASGICFSNGKALVFPPCALYTVSENYEYKETHDNWRIMKIPG